MSKVIKIQNKEVLPLAGRFGRNVSFADLVRRLQRPYTKITDREYDLIMEETKKGLSGKATDYVLFEGDVCTFGQADDGYALMPLKRGYSRKIKHKGYELLDTLDNQGESLRYLFNP